MTAPLSRQIRAAHDEHGLTVYQAYPAPIAEAALEAGTFVAPFKRERMTWIKPSFRWMMYRSGWGTKPGQERVLAVRISREGFEWALAHACLSHYDRDHHASAEAWKAELAASPVRIQWDPERATDLEPLPHRAIQIGLSGEAVDRYVDEWILGLTDVTDLAHEAHALVRAGQPAAADAKIPVETPYHLPGGLAARIAATTTA
ncbi:DUF4291 domain-containing protein [Saccharothrix sp. ST-888]|uniref:DUF4291 domain-containing protein n=1 Tax=Saccharothrix sp. ST-888 TaxID=1427391 RepID=UPI0005EC36A0|nr:DUF4291 domain-containing protein [Saccharothrix sp. ST-888]KJK55345.1 hypothetical protein UK12_29330 [Saccharothrix sp. ST-888]